MTKKPWLASAILSISFTLGQPFAAQASSVPMQVECENIADLTDRLPSPRNQMDTNYCYAFAAADLLTYALKLPRPQAISAAHLVAIADSPFHFNDKDKIEEKLKNFVVADVDSATRARVGNPDPNWFQQPYIEWLKANLDLLSPGHAAGGGLAPVILVAALFQKALCTEADFPSEPFANLPTPPPWGKDPNKGQDYLTPSLQKQLTELSGKFPGSSAAETIGKFCANSSRRIIPSMRNLRLHSLTMLNRESEVSKDHAARFVLSALREENPVAVTFDNGAVLGGESPRSDWSHVAVLVGARWNATQQRCEVKLKNSWGRTADVHCRREDKVECERGYYWVPLRESLSYISSIEYLTSAD